MKPSSGLYKNTSGIKALKKNNKENIVKSINKNKVNKIPEKVSQIDHIFREDEGHLTFSEKNVKIISKLINNEKNITLEKDKNGNTWYSKTNEDGSQIWGKVHNGTLSNGGINKTPRPLDKDPGYDKNPFKKKE